MPTRPRLTAAALACAALAFSTGLSAAPVTVSAGQTAIWNFDFGAVGAALPGSAGIRFSPGTTIFGAQGIWQLFGDLNGAGALLDTFGLNLSATTSVHPDWLDGVFSARLQVTSGSITVDPTAQAWDTTVGPVGLIVPGVLVVAAVPEPATLPLLAAALLAAALASRRSPRLQQVAARG